MKGTLAAPPIAVGSRGLPLGVRNRLAELIVEAFDDEESRATLLALADLDPGLPVAPAERERLARLPWFRVGPSGRVELLADHRAHWPFVRARARSALAALAGPQASRDPAGLLARAARLADAGLYFEVHELLEPWWIRARGPERVALQGLIQVAVGLQHLANGNRAGGRALLSEGLAKVATARGALPLDTPSWERALAGRLATLAVGEPMSELPPWPAPSK